MQTIYIFVYEKINQHKVMFGSTLFEAQNICCGSEIAGLLDHSYSKCTSICQVSLFLELIGAIKT